VLAHTHTWILPPLNTLKKKGEALFFTTTKRAGLQLNNTQKKRLKQLVKGVVFFCVQNQKTDVFWF
jgi:hypothetical protein